MSLVLGIAGGYLALMTVSILFFVTLCRAGRRFDDAWEGRAAASERHLVAVSRADPRR